MFFFQNIYIHIGRVAGHIGRVARYIERAGRYIGRRAGVLGGDFSTNDIDFTAKKGYER